MIRNHLATMLLSSATLAAMNASLAEANLLIDVRAYSKNGSTTAITNPKQVLVAPGDTIVFRVFADVTATDVQIPGKYECLQSLSGSFLSTGSLSGDLSLAP